MKSTFWDLSLNLNGAIRQLFALRNSLWIGLLAGLFATHSAFAQDCTAKASKIIYSIDKEHPDTLLMTFAISANHKKVVRKVYVDIGGKMDVKGADGKVMEAPIWHKTSIFINDKDSDAQTNTIFRTFLNLEIVRVNQVYVTHLDCFTSP